MKGARGSRSFLISAAISLGALGCANSTPACPTGAELISTYTVNYTQVNEGDTCLVTSLPDGGFANSALITSPGTSTFNLCATGADGGTTTLYLDGTALGADSGVPIGAVGVETDVSGSACTCPIDVTDSLYVTLNNTLDGGAFGWLTDGGPDAGNFTPIGNFTGTLDYAVAESADSTTSCTCNLPCGTHFTIAGTH